MSSRSRLVLCAFFLPVVLLFVASAPQAEAQGLPNGLTKRVVGDYGYWSKYDTPSYSAKQIPFNMLTHINHAGVSFQLDGTLFVPDGFIEPDLTARAKAAGVKVLLLLGGNFPALEQSGAAQTLVNNIASFEQEYGYDGVDLDWEYPETTSDRNMMVELMALLRESNPNYVLSIDVPPWGGYGYDLSQLIPTLDYFNIMMYDCAGPWTADGQLNSPIFWDGHDPNPWECQPGGSAQEAATLFLGMVPAQQLNMGTPFYGYFYKNINQLFATCPNASSTPDGDCDNAVVSGNYAQFKPLINQQGWYTLRDPIALVPYMLRTDGGPGYITYDDSESTSTRVSYSDWTLGLGGTFMWSLDADYDGHSQDLMTSMYNASLPPQ